MRAEGEHPREMCVMPPLHPLVSRWKLCWISTWFRISLCKMCLLRGGPPIPAFSLAVRMGPVPRSAHTGDRAHLQNVTVTFAAIKQTCHFLLNQPFSSSLSKTYFQYGGIMCTLSLSLVVFHVWIYRVSAAFQFLLSPSELKFFTDWEGLVLQCFFLLQCCELPLGAELAAITSCWGVRLWFSFWRSFSASEEALRFCSAQGCIC